MNFRTASLDFPQKEQRRCLSWDITIRDGGLPGKAPRTALKCGAAGMRHATERVNPPRQAGSSDSVVLEVSAPSRENRSASKLQERSCTCRLPASWYSCQGDDGGVTAPVGAVCPFRVCYPATRYRYPRFACGPLKASCSCTSPVGRWGWCYSGFPPWDERGAKRTGRSGIGTPDSCWSPPAWRLACPLARAQSPRNAPPSGRAGVAAIPD